MSTKRPINDEFLLGDPKVRLKVVARINSGCRPCIFSCFSSGKLYCINKMRGTTGDCHADFRPDHKYVLFLEINEPEVVKLNLTE